MNLLLLALLLGQPPAHLGSPIIFVRYETEQLTGQKRAGFITKGPFVCPEGTPHAGEWCANVAFFIADPGEEENLDPIICVPQATCMVNPAGLGVATGLERRVNVFYDPTGVTPRSWHLWGEVEGEN